MPHRDNAWNVRANYGNPTRSLEVHEFPSAVKKHEISESQSSKKGHETSRVQNFRLFSSDKRVVEQKRDGSAR
jgi:hypothetical protein